MRPSRRSFALGALAVGGSAASARAAAPRGGGFSVSGKPGPFVKQVAGRNLGGATSRAAGGSLGLASDAVNAGQYQAARLRMPQTEAKVSALLARLDSRWPYAKDQPVKVHILGVDYYNAYSLPDSSIVVAFGLLDQAQSDDEVAFVLAHELGHLRLGHFNAQVAEKRPELASRMGQALLVGAALGAASANSTVVGAAARAGATSDWLHFMVGVSAEPGHTRAQEDEADCIGFDLSQAAAFEADAASARVFDSISADQQKRATLTDSLESQLKSQLGQVVTVGTATSFLAGGFNPGSLRGGLLAGAGRLALGMAVANQQAEPQHRPPEERKRGVAQYSADAYPQGAPLRDEQKVWLGEVRGAGEYAQGKITVEAVADAKKARAAGDYATASGAMARAVKTSFRNAPLVLNEAARLRDDMGDPAAADQLFMAAHASPDQTVDGYLDHVRMLYRTKQNDRAFQIIQRGVSAFNNDPKPFLSLMIAVSRQRGREDDAERYLGQCVAYGDESLANDCRLAAGKKAEPE
ncbi:MAG TPA: M48 family metalloprotease, partial [Caulobacteraceae bacterium]|nr:M48 family metalloprotease [Caulobacteraceae bacterium]